MVEDDGDDEDHHLTPPDAEDLLLRLAAEQEVSPLSMDSVYDPSYVMDISPRPIGGEGPVRSYAVVILRSMCACREPSLTPRESIQWAAYVVVKTLAPIARSHPDPRVFEPLVRGMAEVEAREENHDDVENVTNKTKRIEMRGEHRDEVCATPSPGARRRRRTWYPMRYALGWLLLGELQREPRVAGPRAGAGAGAKGGGGGGGGGEREAVDSDAGEMDAAEWAAGLAGRLAAAAEAEEDEEEGGEVARVDKYSTDLFGTFQVGVDADDDTRRFFGLHSA